MGLDRDACVGMFVLHAAMLGACLQRSFFSQTRNIQNCSHPRSSGVFVSDVFRCLDLKIQGRAQGDFQSEDFQSKASQKRVKKITAKWRNSLSGSKIFEDKHCINFNFNGTLTALIVVLASMTSLEKALLKYFIFNLMNLRALVLVSWVGRGDWGDNQPLDPPHWKYLIWLNWKSREIIPPPFEKSWLRHWLAYWLTSTIAKALLIHITCVHR